jgi:drug/metabolite transporter (DMT)-like permease
MTDLLLSILFSTFIYLTFKISDRYKTDLFTIILINYLTASILGLWLHEGAFNLSSLFQFAWLPVAMIIGIMFMVMFLMIGYATRRAGISITSVSTRISLIIPAIFSMVSDPLDVVTPDRIIAVILALFALFLTIYKPSSALPDRRNIYLPVILFLGAGLTDAAVKYAQHRYIDESNLSYFTAITFLTALLAGMVVTIFRKKPLTGTGSIKTILTGILLGVVNFGSMFFMVRALDSGFMAGSSIFALNNIGIVSLSVFIAVYFFGEKLSNMNRIGIILSILTILLFYSGWFLFR